MGAGKYESLLYYLDNSAYLSGNRSIYMTNERLQKIQTVRFKDSGNRKNETDKIVVWSLGSNLISDRIASKELIDGSETDSNSGIVSNLPNITGETDFNNAPIE